MCSSSHSHENNCSHCAAYTTHSVGSTTYIHGSPDSHMDSSDTYTQDSSGPPTHSHQAVTGCNGCARLDTICKSLQMTNTSISVELECLRLEVSRLKGMQPGSNYSDTTTTLPRSQPSHPDLLPHPHSTAGAAPASYWGTDKVIAWGNGAGAGSRETYEEMCRTNWHGLLGRVHMADIDRLSPEKLKNLDDFLHRNIAKHFPFGGKLVNITLETLWAGFKEIGLKLDERTHFADVTDSEDHQTWPAMQRMRNRVASCHEVNSGWKWYWRGLANETLLECARYRGLFRSDGTLP